MKTLRLLAALAFTCLAPHAWAGLASLGPYESWIATVEGNPPATPITLFAVNRPAAPGRVYYWLTPCSTDMWMIPNMGADGKPGEPKIHAPTSVTFVSQRVQLADDKIPGGRNGKFRKLSAQEALEACGPPYGPTHLSLEGWQLYLKDHDWYALEVEYTPRRRETDMWDNGPEHVSAKLKVTNPGPPQWQYTLDSYYVQNVPGNCQLHLDNLIDKDRLIKERFYEAMRMHSGVSYYDALDRLYNESMRLSADILTFKERALEGACDGPQTARLEELELAQLGNAKMALAELIRIDNANAEAWDTIYNSLLALEKCIVRGGIKIVSKTLMNHPVTAAGYRIVDAQVGLVTGFTVMEQAVKVGDLAVVQILGGGKEPEGCAAAAISMACRVLTDEAWNRAGLNVRVSESKKTVKLIDQIHLGHRPNYALPPDQNIQAMFGKGFMGLGNVTKAKGVCEKFRELYFSTLGTIIRDTGDVVQACGNMDTSPYKNFINTLRDLAIRCTGAYRNEAGKLVPPPGGGMTPPPGGGTPPPPAPPPAMPPPPGGMPPPP